MLLESLITQRRWIAMLAKQSGSKSVKDRGALSARESIARLQQLVDTCPAETAVPLEWAVSAHFLGDVNGLACLRLGSDG
jgi:hypothetical protein